MTVKEAKEKLKYIEDIQGGPTLLDLSKIRFDIDEVEWILTRYNKPDSFSPDDHGPVCSKLVFKGSEDFEKYNLLQSLTETVFALNISTPDIDLFESVISYPS